MPLNIGKPHLSKYSQAYSYFKRRYVLIEANTSGPISKNRSVQVYICLSIFCLLFFYMTIGFANENYRTPGSMWLAGYETFEKAEKVYTTKDYNASLTLYKESLEILKALSSEYPSWNKVLIQYKIKACVKKVKQLNDRLMDMIKHKSSEDLINENLTFQSKIVDFQTLLSQEQKKLKSTLISLKKSQQEVLKYNNVSEQYKKLFKNKIELEKKYAFLSTQIGELSKEKDESETLKNLRTIMLQYRSKLDKTLEEKKQIQKDNEVLEERYQNLSLEKAKIALAKDEVVNKAQAYESRLKISEKKLDKLNTEMSKLRNEKKALQENIGKIGRRLKREQNYHMKLDKNLDTAKSNSGTNVVALQTKNFVLRKELIEHQDRLDELLQLKQAFANEVSEIKSKYSKVNGVLASIEKRRISVEEEVKVLKQDITAKARIEEGYIQKINSLQNALNKGDQEYKLLAKKYSTLEEKKKMFQDTLTRNVGLVKDKKRLNHIIKGFEKQIKEISNEKKTIELAQKELKNEHNRLVAENSNLKTINKKELQRKSLALKQGNEKINELMDARSVQKKKIKKLLENAERANNEFAEVRKQNNQYNEEIQSSNAKFAELKKQYSSQLSKVKKLLDQIKISENKVNVSNLKRDKIQKDFQAAKSKAVELENLKSENLRKIRNLVSMLEATERKNSNSELNRSLVQEKFIILNLKLEELEKTKIGQNAKIKELLAELDSLKGKSPSTLPERGKIHGDLIAATDKINELESVQKEQVQKIKKLQYKLGENNAANKKIFADRVQFQKEFDNANKKIADLESERARNSEKLERLLKKIAEADQKMATANAANERINDDLLAAKNKISKFESSCTEQVELVNKLMSGSKKTGGNALQKQLEYTRVYSQLETAKSKISKLEQAHIQQLNKIKKLVADIKEAEKGTTESRLSHNDTMNKLVQVKNQVEDLETEKLQISNETKKLLLEVDKQKQEIKSLRTAHKKTQKQLLDANRTIKEQEKTRKTQLDQIAKLKNDVKIANEHKIMAETKLSMLQKQQSTANDHVMNLNASRTSQKIKIQTLISELDDTRTGTLKGRLERKRIMDGLTEAQKQTAKLERIHLIQEDELRKIKSDIRYAESEIVALKFVSNNLQKELSESNKLVSTLKTERKTLLTDFRKFSDTISGKDRKINSLIAEKKQLDNLIVSLNREILFNDVPFNKTAKNMTTVSKRKLDRKVEHYRKIAEKAIKDKDKKTALAHYEKICQVKPQDLQALKKTGMLALDLGDYTGAELYLEKVHSLNANDVETLVALGLCFLNKHESLKALSTFSKAASIEKNNPELLNYIGMVCGELGWYDAAARNLEKAIKLSPKSAKIAHNLAVILLSCNPTRKLEAKKWYDTALLYGAKPDLQLEEKLKEDSF
jgi:chromosome segregation ATPase